MPEKKKQHYISQFLLRNFSQPDNPKLINIYNRGIAKILKGVPLKNQAQESYFYGKDLTFEDFLEVTETRTSVIIRKIFQKETLPDYKEKKYSQLLHFIMLFAFRTKASTEKTEEMINSAFKELSKHLEELNDLDLSNGRLKHPEPAAFNLASYMDNWVVTYDLNSVLLINETENDFFLSDNPFIQYNPYMYKRKLYEISGGLINKGLVVFFPLSPKYCFMMYDSWAYKTKEIERKIKISTLKDIDNINILQSISADNNLYFSRTSDIEYVINLSKKGVRNKKDEYINKVLRHPFDPNKKLLFSTHIEHTMTIDFSFLSERENVKKIKDYEFLSAPRNQEIEDWVKMDKKKLHTTTNIRHLADSAKNEDISNK